MGAPFHFFIWIIWTMGFTVLACSVGHLITPHADGSGVPQLKTVLGGEPLRKFFGWRVLGAKLLGLFASQCGFLPIGKEVEECQHVPSLSSSATSQSHPCSLLTHTFAHTLSVLSLSLSLSHTHTHTLSLAFSLSLLLSLPLSASVSLPYQPRVRCAS
jgi:hypothetical protein